MKKLFAFSLLAAILQLPAILVIDTANAQESSSGLEEIVVTARKKEENLQDIPLSITAFSAEELSRRGLQEMEDIALFTPGFNFEDFGGSGYAAPVIRGTTQNRASNRLEQNVAVFFDGVYLPRNYIVDLGFANIERIEIVKGPQSARYGRNAFMGALNYVSKRPAEEWELDVSATAGDGERLDGAVAISGPIVPDVLRLRVGIDHSEFDGSWDNTHPFAGISFDQGTNDVLGGWERTIISAGFELNVTEDLLVSVAYYDYDFNDEHDAQNWFAELNAESNLLNCGQFNPNVRPAGSGLGGGGMWFRLFCGEVPVRNTPIDPRGYARQLESDLLRASVDWQLNDEVSLQYVYGRITADSFSLGYKDTLPGCTFFVPLCVFENGPIGNFETDSHELRVSWDNGGAISTAFGIYFYESSDFGSSNFALLPGLTAVPTAPINVLDPSEFILQVSLRNILTETKAWSPFVEFNWAFSDRARLGVEARYSDETKKEINLASGGGGGVGGFGGNVLEDDFAAFTPRITLEYDLTDENMLFGSIARGIKSGGFNGTATLPQNLSYEQDENWTYELGSRNILYGGRVQLNATLFYIKWSDLQISAQDDGNPNPLPVSIIKNLGDVTSIGVEVDGAWSVNDNLTLFGTLYLGNAEYDDGTLDLRWGRIPSVCDDVVCKISGDISGNQVERQSETQASLGVDWRAQLSGDLDYYVRADVGYQSKMYAEAVNLATVPARTISNASFGITRGQFDVRLWARNLFDEEYVSSVVVGAPNVQYNAYLGERRTYGVTLDWVFGLGN